MTLDKLNVGERFVIMRFGAVSAVSARLEDMGLTVGTKGSVFASSPLKGTVCIAFRGYKLALGKSDLEGVVVRVIK